MRIRIARAHPSHCLGMDINRPFDLVAIAQSMNVPSERIEDPTRIAPALTQALHHTGPTLRDIIIDGSE